MATLKIAQGDTLSAIAQQQGTSVDALVKANPQITDPNLIIAGQDLNLPQITPPTSGLAETVQPISEEIPVAAGQEQLIAAGGTPRPDFGAEIARTATTEIQRAIGQDFQAQKEAVQKDIASLQTTVADRESALEAGLTDDFSRTELRKKLEEESQIKDTEKSLNEILNQMNDKQLAFDRGKQALVGESSTLRLLRGKEALLRDQFNAEMSWLSSKASIVQGNLNRARDTINTYFVDSVNDRTERINNLETLFELDKQKIVKLNAEEKELGKNQIALLSDINARQQDEQDDIRQIMLNNPVAWEASGATLDMSLDDILERITSASAQQAQFDSFRGQTPETAGEFSFATGDRDRLIATGLSVTDIQNIEDRISAGESITDITTDIGITEAQQTTLTNALSGITALQEVKAQEAPSTTKDERLAVALTSATTDFTDKLGGWGVSEQFQQQFNLPKKINDRQLTNFLVEQFQINITDAEKIVQQAEKGSGLSK